MHRGCSRALVARQNGAVRMTIFSPHPWKIKAGQHVNIWIPSISLWSFLQSHPFTIASWSEGEKSSLDFLIEPRDGFTRKLFERAPEYQKGNVSLRGMEEGREPQSKADDMDKRLFGDARNSQGSSEPAALHLAFFSGPHCSGAPIGDYGKVLMVATGFGIAAQLPFLKELIQGFNRSEVRTRNIHLVWQLNDLGDEYPAIELLDRALREDTLDHGYMLQVWLFFRDGRLDPSPQHAGKHQRALYHNGAIDLPHFLQDQVGPRSEKDRGKILVTVSANEQIRDELRNLIQPYLGVRLLELDYQPAESS
ncbi:hypothetical protein N7G274_000661 [Stereocaulon virgatum]|uniref:ferric-chelate reductase (NADPH) n=1 Tax=Stereocaulon virgatum TaxID=373712 RepID=A0ABR4AQ14_9LECA